MFGLDDKDANAVIEAILHQTGEAVVDISLQELESPEAR